MKIHNFFILTFAPDLRMKPLLTYTTILLLAPFSMSAKAQNTVSYTYDAAGNRITRQILLSQRQVPEDSLRLEKSKEVHTDVIAKKNVHIYPNPTQGVVKVEVIGLEKSERCQMAIYTSSGQQIASIRATSTASEFDLSSQPNGIYLLHISVSGSESTWKIIKK